MELDAQLLPFGDFSIPAEEQRDNFGDEVNGLNQKSDSSAEEEHVVLFAGVGPDHDYVTDGHSSKAVED